MFARYVPLKVASNKFVSNVMVPRAYGISEVPWLMPVTGVKYMTHAKISSGVIFVPSASPHLD